MGYLTSASKIKAFKVSKQERTKEIAETNLCMTKQRKHPYKNDPESI